MSRVLVTGAAGFVGVNLTRSLLASGNEVFIFLRPQSKTWRLADILPKLKVYSVDLADAEAVKKAAAEIQPDYVYHLATYGGYPSQKDTKLTLETNVFGTLNLLQALENSSLKKFINIGSSSEYGLKDEAMKVTDFLEPTTPYGVAKACQTHLATYFAKQKGLPVTTLRFFSVYGPYEEKGRLFTALMIGAIQNQPVELSSPLPRRDFVFVGDAVEACQKAAENSSAAGEIFNVGSGQDYSLGEAVELAEKAVNQKLTIKWGAAEGRSFDAGRKWVGDIKKTKELLGWQPRHSFNDGLLKTYEWYRENINLYD